jgi:hypothetical protein
MEENRQDRKNLKLLKRSKKTDENGILKTKKTVLGKIETCSTREEKKPRGAQTPSTEDITTRDDRKATSMKTIGFSVIENPQS